MKKRVPSWSVAIAISFPNLLIRKLVQFKQKQSWRWQCLAFGDFYDFLSPFFLRLRYKTLKTVSLKISKHLEADQKLSAARRIFTSLLGVWKSWDKERYFVLIYHLNMVLFFSFLDKSASCWIADKQWYQNCGKWRIYTRSCSGSQNPEGKMSISFKK